MSHIIFVPLQSLSGQNFSEKRECLISCEIAKSQQRIYKARSSSYTWAAYPCLYIQVFGDTYKRNMEDSPLSLTINIVEILQTGCLRRTLVKFAIMKVFWKAFLGGVIAAILTFLFVPLLADGISPSVAIAKMTSTPLKAFSLLESICVVGLAFGCIFSLFSWLGKRSRERKETDDLMREYLKKKMKEENNEQ